MVLQSFQIVNTRRDIGDFVSECDSFFLLLQLTDIVNAMSSRGELPLELALRGRSSSIATTLLQHCADADARGPRGRTLLHRAVDARDAFSAKFLVENGADPNLTTK